MWVVSAIGFVAACLGFPGILVPATWWQTLAVMTAIISLGPGPLPRLLANLQYYWRCWREPGHPHCPALATLAARGVNNLAVREYLSLTLEFDHDIIDGAPAARFAQRFKELIEQGVEQNGQER